MPGDIKAVSLPPESKMMPDLELYGEAIDISVAIMERDESQGMTPRVSLTLSITSVP